MHRTKQTKNQNTREKRLRQKLKIAHLVPSVAWSWQLSPHGRRCCQDGSIPSWWVVRKMLLQRQGTRIVFQNKRGAWKIKTCYKKQDSFPKQVLEKPKTNTKTKQNGVGWRWGVAANPTAPEWRKGPQSLLLLLATLLTHPTSSSDQYHNQIVISKWGKRLAKTQRDLQSYQGRS